MNFMIPNIKNSIPITLMFPIISIISLNILIDFGLPLASFGDNRSQLNYNFDDGPFVNMRFIYNVSLDN